MSANRLVAHCVRTYLTPTETFVHGQIVGGERWSSLVLARRKRDVERFPLGGRELLLTDDGLGPAQRRWAELCYSLRHLTRAEARGAARALRERDVALVHAHFGTDARFFRAVYRALDCPLVTSFYGYDSLKFPRRAFGLGARYLRPVLAESARILVPCRDMASDLERLGAEPHKLAVLPWGIDLERFRPRPAERGPELPLRCAMVCRLIAKKGVLDALAAFDRAREQGLAATLAIAGDGPLRARCEREVVERGLADQVEFPGALAPLAVPEFLAQKDVFLQPSVTAEDGDKEGTPTAIMEAQAMGLPVIATRHGGIPDVVLDGVTGLLANEHDVEALARHMLALARSPALRRELGAAGRRRMAEHFERGAQTRARERLYDEVVEARGGGRH